MNIRKVINLLDYMAMIAMSYVIWNEPVDFVMISTYIFGTIILLELLFLGSEYFTHSKSNEIHLLEKRTSVDLDLGLYAVVIIAFLITLSQVWDTIEINASHGLLFSFVTALRGIFAKQRKSIRVDSERILFGNLFETDIWIGEIKSATVDTDKNNIELTMHDNQVRSLKLNGTFFKTENETIENVLNELNSIAS